MIRFLKLGVVAALLLSGCNSGTGPQTYEMSARDVRSQLRSIKPGSVLQNSEFRAELVRLAPDAIQWRIRHEEGPDIALLTAQIEAISDGETRLTVTADRPSDPRSRALADNLPSYEQLLDTLVAATTEQIDAKLENREFNPRAMAISGAIALGSLARDEQSGATERAREAAKSADEAYRAEAAWAEEGGWGEPR